MNTPDQTVIAPLRRASSALNYQALRERCATLPEDPALALADLLDLIDREAVHQRIPTPVFDAAVKVASGILTAEEQTP